jgi:hypothetical protein
MTITFESESDVIVYALERIVPFAREHQYLFVANSVWWLASIIGLEQGLINHIDNLRKIKSPATFAESSGTVHPDRIHQILSERAVSSTPRDLMEDQRLDQVPEEAEKCLETSKSIRSTWQQSRINPLPETWNQPKKARKVKRLQEGKRKSEVERNKGLEDIRATVIKNLSRE